MFVHTTLVEAGIAEMVCDYMKEVKAHTRSRCAKARRDIQKAFKKDDVIALLYACLDIGYRIGADI